METQSLREHLLDDNVGREETEDLNEALSNEVLGTKSWFWRELTLQFWIAGPMVLVNILQYSLNIISLMFVGQQGRLALASSSIATSLAGAFGYHLMLGLASGLETLCGQAFGAKEYKLCGVFLQRAILLLTLICLPISILFWKMSPVLVFMGQDSEIAAGAELYARYLIPNLFAYAFLQPLVKFLQTQSAVSAMALFAAIALVIHLPLCYVLVEYTGLGFRGAALANGISQWIDVIFLVLYVKFSPSFKKTWKGFSAEAFHDLLGFLKFAVPAAVMVCLEYWSFEFLVLLSGLLPNPQLESSTLAICLNTVALLYMIPFGLSAAVSTRVANELGAHRPQFAKAAVGLAVGLALLEGTIVDAILLSVRNCWPRLFSSDEAVVTYVAHVVPFLAGEVILDAYQGTLSGVARGCGWQDLGALTNLGAFYVVGIPVALVLAFHFHLNGYGLWIGLICGLAVQSFLLTCITLTLNWEKLADKAVKLVQQAEQQSDRASLPKHADET